MAGTADELRELAARFRRIAGTGDATDENIRSAEADGGRLISSLIHQGRYTLSDGAQLTYLSVAPFEATDARLREYQLSWLWQLVAADILPADMRQPSECGDNHAAAERNALAAERLADRVAEVVPPEPDQDLTDEPVTPAEPKVYLTSWREILDALSLTPHQKDKVAKLNKDFDGPIVVEKQGAQPRVERSTLLAWYNGLEARFQEVRQRHRDRQATTAGGYSYGKEGTVVQEISGSVKKRRRDAKR